jgi:hypothetical protein
MKIARFRNHFIAIKEIIIIQYNNLNYKGVELFFIVILICFLVCGVLEQ